MPKLYKYIAKRNNGKLAKGMSVEIVSKHSVKPRNKEVAKALNQKYNTNINEGHCGASNFDILTF